MGKRKISQEQIVLGHLKKYGTITAWEAMNDYHILDLAGRIRNLRKEYEIETDMQYKKDTHFAIYRMGVSK